MTPCSAVVGYQRFHAASVFRVKWRWVQHGPLKRRYPTTALHGVITCVTSIWIFTAVKTSNLTITFII